MSSVENKSGERATQIDAAIVEAYNTGDVDALDEYLSDDFVCHHVAAGVEITGVPEFKERILQLREAFPDFEMTGEFLVADGDRGAGHYRWQGTHDGEFQGIPATGRSVETTSASLFRMDGDRLAETWVYGDTMGLLGQLGVELP